MSWFKMACTILLCCGTMSLGLSAANAHQLWIEVAPVGTAAQQQTAHVCWGHSGHRMGGQMLASQQGRLSASLVRPGAQAETLPLTLGTDSYTASLVPSQAGYYLIGAEVQAGILDREFHGIPAKTRLIMSGKTFLHVPGSEAGLQTPVGMDLELIPVGDPKSWRPGGVATVRVLFKGKPVGGRTVEVSLNTVGNKPLPQDPRIEGLAWSVKDNADPRSGEVSFPLIVAGQHEFQIRHMDETPGQYEGAVEMATKFSHLRKGDAYERTQYMATMTIQVAAE